MKNWFIVLFIVFLLTIAAGCQSKKTENNAVSTAPSPAQPAAQTATDVKETNQKINVDKGLLDVEVTLPASFLNGQDLDKVIEKAKSDGVKDAKKNTDGSVTYTISKAKHAEMMKSFEDGILKSVDDLKSGKDFKSIKNTEVNKKYDEFTVIVDKNAFGKSFDAFGLLGLGMTSMYYQLFDGVASDKIKATIHLKDEATNTVFQTLVYPDDLNKSKK